ncbi:MAG: FAD:protein FMN transferase [Rhodanobacteraceae bacterium]|nr:MAG: FAD:protein FMN transferase [Rhodanobacteraceae bacterium]
MRIVDPMLAPASPGRRRILKAVAGAAALGVLGGGGWFVARRARNLFEVRRERTLMQTTVAITCLDEDVTRAGIAIDAAYVRMGAAVAVLTRFDPEGPVGRLNRTGRLEHPPRELRDVLGRSQAISALTDGDFDVSVLPVLRFFESLQVPVVLDAADREAVARRDRLVNYRQITMDASGIRFAHPGMAITLDGLAKGYVIDQGIAALQAGGIETALIDAGGDLRAISSDRQPHQWHVGIIDPADVNRMAAVVSTRNAALGTSGNYRIFYSADRRLYHVINPHTGYSPQNYASVTVMADNSMDADAMSVAAASMPLRRVHEVLASQNQQWLLFARDGGRRWRSWDLPMVSGQAEVA